MLKLIIMESWSSSLRLIDNIIFKENYYKNILKINYTKNEKLNFTIKIKPTRML